MKTSFLILAAACLLASCSTPADHSKAGYVIANGQMPSVAVDEAKNIHLVYGIGDTIFYRLSADKGKSFSTPVIVTVLPHVFTFATRGPQVAATNTGVIVTGCTSTGDVYSYTQLPGGKWSEGNKINDVDTSAKEGLMALGADGDNAFAVWLDLRGNKHNKIYGAASTDGGKTWSANQAVYISPDSSVCECCKPSVLVKGKNVYVMFRNQINGNRDLYLIQSSNGGSSFGAAQKLGEGSWQLNGCPMDGGAIALNNSGEIQTVWRREGKLFAAVPGKPEKEIGEGKGCTMETIDGKNAYAWSQNGDVVVLTAAGERKVAGKGTQAVIKAIGNNQLICVWEDEKQVRAAVVE